MDPNDMFAQFEEAKRRAEEEAAAQKAAEEAALAEADAAIKAAEEEARRQLEEIEKAQAEAERIQREAEEAARQAEEEARRQAEIAAQKAAEAEARAKAEAEAAEKRAAQLKAQAEAEERAKKEAAAKAKAEEEARIKAEKEAAEQAKREAEQKAKEEAQAAERAKKEAEEKAKEEARRLKEERKASGALNPVMLGIAAVIAIALIVGSFIVSKMIFGNKNSGGGSDVSGFQSEIKSAIEKAEVEADFYVAQYSGATLPRLCIANNNEYIVYYLEGTTVYKVAGKYTGNATNPATKIEAAKKVKTSGGSSVCENITSFFVDTSKRSSGQIAIKVRSGSSDVKVTNVAVKAAETQATE